MSEPHHKLLKTYRIEFHSTNSQIIEFANANDTKFRNTVEAIEPNWCNWTIDLIDYQNIKWIICCAKSSSTNTKCFHLRFFFLFFFSFNTSNRFDLSLSVLSTWIYYIVLDILHTNKINQISIEPREQQNQPNWQIITYVFVINCNIYLSVYFPNSKCFFFVTLHYSTIATLRKELEILFHRCEKYRLFLSDIRLSNSCT